VPSKPSILVVDDEPGILYYLSEILEDFHVHKAASAEEAMKLLADNPICCVVADINLPGVNGIDLLERVKREKPLVPVIMMTGHGAKQYAIDAIRSGAYDFLDKPFSKDLACVAVERAYKTYQALQRESLLNEQIKTSNEQLKKLNMRILAVQEEERKRIASELHDELGQLLMVFNLDLHYLQSKLKNGDPEVINRISKMQQVLTHAVETVRHV
jgi:DNA-binding NtrC family response regulator